MVEEPKIGKMGEEEIPVRGGGLKKVLLWVVPLVIVVAVVLVFILSGGDEEAESQYYELVARGNTAFNRENYEEAKDLYVQALEVRPDDEVSTRRIAVIDSIMALPEQEGEEAPETVVEEIRKEPAAEEEIREEDTPPVEEVSESDKPEPEKPVKKDSMEKKKAAVEYKYHIIVGAFENMDNALKYSRKLKERGVDSRTVPISGGKMTAVTYGSFNNKEEAVRELRRVQREVDRNAWLLER